MFPNVGGGNCAEKWRVLGLSSRVGLRPAGEEPEHLQSTYKLPLSKVLDAQMFTWDPAMRRRLQRSTLPLHIVYVHPPCDFDCKKVFKGFLKKSG